MSDSDSGEHTMDTDKLIKKRAKKHRDRGNKKKKRKQEDEGLLDHFFSGLANRNLDHILTKIISYLPGEDVRSCLWTCRVLRQAAMSDREAMSKEMMTTALKLKFRRKLKPRSVSDKFETDFDEWSDYIEDDEPFSLNSFLRVEARDTPDGETGNIMEKIDVKALSSPNLDISDPANRFGKNWENRIKRIAGFQDFHCDWMDHGDLVLVEKVEKRANKTKCALVRLDKKKKNKGKIIDRWNYMDIVDKNRDQFNGLRYPDSYLGGWSCRGGNMVFYIYFKKLYYKNKHGKTPVLVYPKRLLFALMVDLDKDKVLWRKQVGHEFDWDQEKTFITDKICGFLGYADNTRNNGAKKLRRFDVETGEEMSPEGPEKFLEARMELAASSNNVVALISNQKSYEQNSSQYEFFCQTLDAGTGSTLRRYCLAMPPNKTTFGIGHMQSYKKDPFRFALFGGRILVMCQTDLNSDYSLRDYTAWTCFAFWDLEKLMGQRIKVGVHCWRGPEERTVYKKEKAEMVMGKVIWLDGFDNVGPSLTGNIWYLLKSETDDEYDEGLRVFHTLHAVNINRSVGDLWNGNLIK